MNILQTSNLRMSLLVQLMAGFSDCRCRSTCPQRTVAGEITARSRPPCPSCPSPSARARPAACRGRASPWKPVRGSQLPYTQRACCFQTGTCFFGAELLFDPPPPPPVQDTSSEPPFTRTVQPTASPRRLRWTPASGLRRRSQVVSHAPPQPNH